MCRFTTKNSYIPRLGSLTKPIDFLLVALLLQECDRGMHSLSLDALSEQDKELVRFCADNNLLKLRTLNGRERVKNITLNGSDLLNGYLDPAIWSVVEQALGDALAIADVDLILDGIARAWLELNSAGGETCD